MILLSPHPFGTAERRARYLCDPMPVRLGNPAATLARLSSSASASAGATTVLNMLAEALHFTEWTGPEAAPEIQPELARIQVELARWRIRWPAITAESQRAELSRLAREMADQVLDWSGLLAD